MLNDTFAVIFHFKSKSVLLEIYHTVFISTFSGKPTKKRQNVQDLMEEARRILDQSGKSSIHNTVSLCSYSNATD
jgi:hypothetical protein